MGTSNPNKRDQSPPAVEEETPFEPREEIQGGRDRQNLILRKPKIKRQKKK